MASELNFAWETATIASGVSVTEQTGRPGSPAALEAASPACASGVTVERVEERGCSSPPGIGGCDLSSVVWNVCGVGGTGALGCAPVDGGAVGGGRFDRRPSGGGGSMAENLLKHGAPRNTTRLPKQDAHSQSGHTPSLTRTFCLKAVSVF